MIDALTKTRQLIAPLLLTGLLTACGGGDSSSSNTDTTTPQSNDSGSVSVMLTDAPADLDLFSAINATIERIELIGGDDTRVSLFEGPAETIDLLSLRNEAIPFAYRDDVPAGSYCKIRLTLSQPDGLELVLAEDSTSEYPHLPGNGKIDLLARGCFSVAEGSPVSVQIDLDAGNSIHIVQTGNRTHYNFRPVIFIDVIDADFAAKLVRMDGVIRDSDTTAQSLLLCDTLPSAQSDAADCITVQLGLDSAYFDNLTEQGDTQPLNDLLLPELWGTSASVVGLTSSRPTPMTPVEIPEEAWPGTGFCRLWEPGVDTSAQSSPDDQACDNPDLHIPSGWVLIDDQGQTVVDHRPRLTLDTLVAETGTFGNYAGNVTVDATAYQFTLESDTTPLLINLQNIQSLAAGGMNGTRILSNLGEVLDYTAITAPLSLTLDGVAESDNEIKAALVIIDPDQLGLTAASGEIASLSSGGFILIPETGTTPCDVSGDLTVTTTSDTVYTTVTTTADQVEVAPGGDPQTGQSVNVNGTCDSAGLTATSVVILIDQTL
ncbi:MAG: DUF4382 domain-containing protein [Candidatus Thiodiazotropha sp.]